MIYGVSETRISTQQRESILQQIEGVLKDARRVLVVSHIDPDGDALGSQIAFGAYVRHLGKEALLVKDSSIPEKYAFLSGAGDILDVSDLPADTTVDTALVLECPSIERVGAAQKLLTRDVKIINIDHHPDARDFGTVNWVETTASSVGEMTFEFFDHVGFEISPAVAEALYTAILTDTGRFRYPSTSPRTMCVAAELVARGARPQDIVDHVYYNMRVSTVRLIGKILNKVEFYHDNKICLLTLTRDMLENSGADIAEAEGVVDYTMVSRTARAGALLKEMENGSTKVSLRSRDGIDVSSLAAQFSGGGHVNAAGCVIDLPLAEAREKLVGLLKEAVDGR
jgi:phosphoesterase RecJ-like protein